MKVQRAGDVPDWFNALGAASPKEPVANETPSNEEEAAAGINDTLNSMFGTNIKTSPEDAVRSASGQIVQATHEQEIKQAEAEDAKGDRFKPLVAPTDKNWQKVSGQSEATNAFNAETARSGKITASHGLAEEVASQKTSVPQNSNSIFDPFRLDELAAKGTAHDRRIEAERAERAQAKKARWDADSTAREASLPPVDVKHLQGGKIHSLAGEGNSEFIHRVPANQISMVDNIGPKDASPEQLKASLEALFTHKIPDTRTEIREANEKRKEEIQRPKGDKDKSWEKVDKPTTTAELTRRLTETWLPPEPENPENSGK